tara:strand:+ start:23427 stop:27431 length:4005 start_codon:yes stop_codon:yes gene_type:complete
MPFSYIPHLSPGVTYPIYKEEFPSITLFDASTFYNWEQDNIPIQELKERTDTLFQHVGLNQLHLPSETVTYTLSTVGSVDSTVGVYDDIQDILDLIPKRLTYPILVEICTYGVIPTFELANIVTEGDGQLDIINRLYSHTPSSLGKAASSVFGEGRNSKQSFITSAGDTSDDLSSKAWYNIHDASSHRFGINLYDEVAWEQRTSRGFMQNGPDMVEETKRMSCMVEGISTGNADKTWGGMPYRSDVDTTIITNDVDPSAMSNWRNDITEVVPLSDSRAEAHVATEMSSYLYGNVCSGVTVRGCHGKIALRNLCADGSNNELGATLVHERNHGFEIVDSDVLLESCASMRFRRAGIYAKNSSVSLASGVICYRNYDLSGGTREIIGSDEYGIGLHAVNSEIFFETVNEDSGTSKLDNATQPNERRNLYNFIKNDTGILLESSKLHGGTLWNHGGDGLNDPPRTRGTSVDRVTSFLQMFGNNIGLKLESSQITYLGVFESFLNNYGVKANNSVLKLTQFNVEDNTHVGFDLDSSKLIYGYLGNKIGGGALTGATLAIGHWANSSSSYKRAYTCSQNGQNLIIHNSSQCIPAEVGSVVQNLGTWGGAGASINSGNKSLLYDYMHAVGASPATANVIGAINSVPTCDLPAIVVTGGSYAEFIGLACTAKTNAVATKGACVSVTDNSKVDFRGHALGWTTLTGTPVNSMAAVEQGFNWLTAGVYAGNNSSVQFTGPTKISRFGVPVLVEDGSTVKFGPPVKRGTSVGFDLDRFDVSTGLTGSTNNQNHTKVEIHSTRAGLVANRNSNIILQNIGGWAGDGQLATTVDSYYNSTSPNDMANTVSSCTSAGYFRFFPNGFTRSLAGKECITLANNPTNHGRGVSLVETPGDPGSGGMWHRGNYTNGGMCVRAVGNSNIDVNGVNFSFEYSPSSTSGVYYDAEGNDRARTDAAIESTHHFDPYNYNGQAWWPAPGAALTGPTKSYYMLDSSSFSQFGASSLVAATALYVDTKDSTLYSASGFSPAPPVSGSLAGEQSNISYAAYASNLMLWNVADTSRIHVANVKMSQGTGQTVENKMDPSAFCITKATAHGPRGKWANGVALDYFGEGGLATSFSPKLRTANTGRHYENYGMFRLLLGHRGDLKSLVEVSAGAATGAAHVLHSPNSLTNGGAIDQINSAGYQTYVSQAIPLSGSDERLVMGLEGGADYSLSGGNMQLSGVEDVFGQGWAAKAINEPGGIQGSMSWYHDSSGNMRGGLPNSPIPPIHMDWQGYIRNWLDESASNLFTNAKHAASKKVNALSIYRSTSEAGRGGEGRDESAMSNSTFGVGVRSLNLFDLDRLL